MEDKFLELLKEALEIDDRDLNLNDEFRSYPEWDSLALLSVIAMIDDEFDVIIDGNIFSTLKSNSDILNYINSVK